jgi:hypothetical protein
LSAPRASANLRLRQRRSLEGRAEARVLAEKKHSPPHIRQVPTQWSAAFLVPSAPESGANVSIPADLTSDSMCRTGSCPKTHGKSGYFFAKPR